MSVTVLGLVVFSLCGLYAFNPDRLAQILIMGSAFSSAAVAVFGSFGLGPAQIPLALFVCNVCLQILLGVQYTGTQQVWWTVLPFVLVAFWAVTGALVLPEMFSHAVYVWPQKYDGPTVGSIPLAPSSGNLTQPMYMLSNTALLVTSALYSSREGADSTSIVRAFIIAGFAVAGISYWQFASNILGVPFPTEFFYSNPGWAQLYNQISGGANRINGSFSEPAALAGYMFGVLCAMIWMVIKGHQGRAIRVLIILGIITLLLTTSTTGYAALTLLAIAIPLYAMSRGSPALVRRVFAGGFLLIVVLGLAGFAVVTFSPGAQTIAANVVAETLDKRESSSYDMRSSADLDSLATLLPTYGLGVGWGSNRSSSLVPGLLAGLGVYGTLLVLWFAFRVIGMVRRAGPHIRLRLDSEVIDCVTGYLIGIILTSAIAGPTIGAAEFYLMLGVLIGTTARIVAQSGARRPLAAWSNIPLRLRAIERSRAPDFH